MKTPEKQVGGSHYQHVTPQPIVVGDIFDLHRDEMAALKYLARLGATADVSKKKVLQDLNKAAYYIRKRVAYLEERLQMLDRDKRWTENAVRPLKEWCKKNGLVLDSGPELAISAVFDTYSQREHTLSCALDYIAEIIEEISSKIPDV